MLGIDLIATNKYILIKTGESTYYKIAAKNSKTQQTAAPEVKPAESKPAAKPVDESKQTGKNAANAAVDYNKVVSTEKEVKPDGTVCEYQWNAIGELLKTTSFDNDGKIIREINNKYDSNGNKIEFNYKGADGYENTKLYNNGVVEKIKTKGPLGEGDLTRVGDGIYEGIRIKPDGTQVKIRFNDKTYKTTELGPVEAPKAAEQAPKAGEAKPVAEQKVEAPKSGEAKPVAEQKVEASKAEEVKLAEQKPTEPKPAEPKPEAAVDYNKSVRSKLSKSSDGSTNEYFYNEKGDMVKLIERDNTGKIEYKTIHEYNSSGEKVKDIWQTSDGIINEIFYNKGTEIKKVWKWNDGRVDEFNPKGNGIYEGVRTYPDGKKVKIREENNSTKELGLVEQKNKKGVCNFTGSF